MVRFLHIADLHLGAPQHPSVYSENALPKLVDLYRKHECSTIVVIGDIFDKPNPDQRDKDYLVSQLIRYPDVNWVFTVGNHDYTSKAKNYHSLVYLSLIQPYIKNIKVCESGYHQLPMFDLQVFDDEEDLKKLPANSSTEDRSLILAWHGILPGLHIETLDSDNSPINSTAKNLMKQWDADYFALGHIHKSFAPCKNCYYPGSLVQKNYEDEDGIRLVEIEGKIKSRLLRLDLPKKVILNIEFEEGKDTEREVIDAVKGTVGPGQMIKLKFYLPISVYAALDKRKIEAELLKLHLEVKIVNNPTTEKRIRKYMVKISEAKSDEEIVDILLEENDYGLDKKRLKTYCLNRL